MFYKDRSNLDIIMPALGKIHLMLNYVQKMNEIVISNFCSDDVIENHIENYLKYSKLKKSCSKKNKIE